MSRTYNVVRYNDASIDDVFINFKSLCKIQSGCWIWTGFYKKTSKTPLYFLPAKLSFACKNYFKSARRWSVYLSGKFTVDEIKVELFPICKNNLCVNPDHLELNTPHNRFINSFYVDDKTECWIWIENKTSNGYGMIANGKKNERAHRYSYKYYYNTDIPSNLCVCHHCDNTLCVNPEHLFLGTHADNMNDMKIKGRSSRGSKSKASKLLEDDVLFIREQAKLGIKPEILSNKFGVTSNTILGIIMRKRWGWLK